jgi:hypothetical protein
VAGCTSHADCAAADRCDLVTPGHLNHCEARDCLGDLDCLGVGEVCDTDGLATPDGGGYCVPGCQSHYDCGQAGYDCDPGTGRCLAHDYGDIGLDCGSGCHSGLCLAGQGNVCTGYCCVQHDCPAGWGCRPYDDGTGSGHTVDVCQPATPAQGDGEYDDPCTDPSDCRSGICTLNRCAETCCTHADCAAPFATDRICLHGGDTTICSATPATGTDPLGTTGCSTTGTPADCLSNLCYYYFFGDHDCPTNACPADYQCFDLGYGGAPLECVRDFCVDHCCTAADCPDDAAGNHYTCGKVRFGMGADYDVCLLDRTPGALGEGEACTQDSQCRSRFCSQPAGLCRARCCRDTDCADPAFPRCALEASRNQTRFMNVCVP